MPLQLSDLVLPVLWLLAVSALLWACLPPLLHVLGLCRYSQRIDLAAADLGPNDDEPDFDDVYHQLTALGFTPLAAYWDRFWFFYFHWVKSFRTRVFLHPKLHCYACVYRLAKGEPVRLAFVTCFTDESLVWTGNSLEAHQFPEEDWVRWGFVTDDLARLLSLHQEVAEKFATAARQCDTRDELATLLAPIAKVNERHIRQNKRPAVQVLKVAAFSLCSCPVLAAWSKGINHWSVPVGVLCGGIGWVAFRFLWPYVLRIKRGVEIAHRACKCVWSA